MRKESIRFWAWVASLTDVMSDEIPTNSIDESGELDDALTSQ